MNDFKIGIIGAGRVGCALAIGLDKKGYCICGVGSRNSSTLGFLEERLSKHFHTDFFKVVNEADVVFITVPDTFIEEVGIKIAHGLEKQQSTSKTFFHCSGSLTSDALMLLKQRGAAIASMHPVQTFADLENGWRGLENIYFGFEGCDIAKQTAKELVEAFDSKLMVMQKNDKPLYHAAACILSNYAVALTYMSAEILSRIGLEPENAIEAFSPLLVNTVKNIADMGPVKALTGPIARGDAGVVEKHLAAMKSLEPKFEKLYRLLGKLTVEIALTKESISEKDAEKLNRVLEC